MLQKPFHGNYSISQKFGENLNTFYKAQGILGHQGLDFAMPNGTPIISACDGLVIFIATDIQKGEGVTVMSDEIFQWNGQDCKLSCVYWHLKDKSIVVKVGDKVKTGNLLGLSNNTGQTTGPHLHFSIAPLSIDGARRILAEDNGYKGCIDPFPYLNLATPHRILKKGMSGADVLLLQQKLNVFPRTGFFWTKTATAVRAFQIINGLTPDEIVGSQTWEKLNI